MAAPKMNNSHAAVRRACSIHVANASSISAWLPRPCVRCARVHGTNGPHPEAASGLRAQAWAARWKSSRRMGSTTTRSSTRFLSL